MPAVFISYSRRDKGFVERLHDALAAREYDVWVDWEDIPPSAEWFEEIRAGVRNADGFIYVISPDSVASEVCSRELGNAVDQNKRIVPVVCREPDGAAVPEQAAALNWVFLRVDDDFDAGVEQLVSALETDLEHVRTHTRLGVAAARWESSDHDRSLLLRGSDLTAAEAWLVAGAGKQPEATQLQRQFVLSSRQAASRRQRATIGAVSFALAIAVVLAIVALVQRSTAIHERDVASARFLDVKAQANATVDPERGVLLAVQAARIVPGPVTEQALREALAASHIRATFSFPGATSAGAVWSPDGTRLLVSSYGVSANIYRPGTDTPPVSLPAPATDLPGVWDAGGDRVAFAGEHAAVYDAATGRVIVRLPGDSIRIALSPDGSRVATTDFASDGHVFDVATGRLLATFHPIEHGGVTCFAWAPDGSVIAQCDAQSTGRSTAPASLDLWDPATGRLLHSDPTQYFVQAVVFSPEGRRFAYTTTRSTTSKSIAAIARSEGLSGTFVRDTRTNALVTQFPGSASVLAFRPDGDAVAYATVGNDFGNVYDFTTRLTQVLTGNTAVINSISFNHAGTDVVTGGADRVSRVFDASTGQLLEQLYGDTGPILAASFGLNDTAIATSSADGDVHVWASPDPQPTRQVPLGQPAGVVSAGFTLDGSRIVEAGAAGQGVILGAGDLYLVAGFSAPAGYRFAGAAASHDGSMIGALAYRLSGGKLAGAFAETFDVRTGRSLATITPTTPGGVLVNAAINPAGDRLVTVESNGDAEQWDPRTGRRLGLLPGSGDAVLAAYSPDGSTLAIVHKPAIPARLTFQNDLHLGAVTIDLWNPVSGRLVRQITGPQLTPVIPAVKEFAPMAIAFSANSHAIALVGADTNVWVWNIHSGAQAAPLAVSNGQFAVSVVFSPNDKMLAAGTAAGADVWQLSAARPEADLFQHADPSQYGIETGGSVLVGFTRDSRILVTAGDLALEAWDPVDHLQLFHAFAGRGSLNYQGTAFVATAGDRLSLYPCGLCGRLPQLLQVAKRYTTRGLTPAERALFLTQR